MSGITGLHHVTAISGDAQENLDFYVGVMGMRLVKRSVNQDSPGTYHLFYADAEGSPGTDLTFFPWPDLPRGRKGAGITVEVALAVPSGSLDFWRERLAGAGITTSEPVVRFSEETLLFEDPHGLSVALVATGDPRDSTPWAESPVPPRYQVRGLHVTRLVTRDLTATTQFIMGAMGYVRHAEEDGWHRFAVNGGGSGKWLDLREDREAPRGTWGVGSVHHVAFRVPDDSTELAVRGDIEEFRRNPTPVIDRFWFKSVYFKEPGGALFEIATDGPGFAVDESMESLGETLVLPPWLEPQRAEIEAALPKVRVPVAR
ncbi:MAG TPA: ring-cleaving dioxygenase [Gemmatimonadales bacterium]|nr:ring-cleaving dioxygenase [Gemmatimonadales bacterium]